VASKGAEVGVVVVVGMVGMSEKRRLGFFRLLYILALSLSGVRNIALWILRSILLYHLSFEGSFQQFPQSQKSVGLERGGAELRYLRS
jgi:hypothetical protein